MFWIGCRKRRLDLAYQLYPDPWPKKRHWKRRFINEQNLDRYARALEAGQSNSGLPATSTPTLTGRCAIAALTLHLNGQLKPRRTGKRPGMVGQEHAMRPRRSVKAGLAGI